MFSIVDLSQNSSKISPYISSTLLENIEKCLTLGEKTILYLNKRGSYSSLICEDCHYLFECPYCDTSLSVHSNPSHLKCHICHNNFRIPLSCKNCHGSNLKNIGVGTQSIEIALQEYFKEKSISIYRFDSDSVKTLSAKKQAISDLKQADIIIGTKMITTGFDFKAVGCIWVLLVEWELQYPSYHSFEKAYSNLRQLIGRWNRKHQKTEIILQSFIPKNSLIQKLSNGNFKDFLEFSLTERKNFSYPPYKEYCKIEYRHISQEKALSYMQKLKEKIEVYARSDSTILLGTGTQKKHKQHHATLIIKWSQIRSILVWIQSDILRESKLSVSFNT